MSRDTSCPTTTTVSSGDDDSADSTDADADTAAAAADAWPAGTHVRLVDAEEFSGCLGVTHVPRPGGAQNVQLRSARDRHPDVLWHAVRSAPGATTTFDEPVPADDLRLALQQDHAQAHGAGAGADAAPAVAAQPNRAAGARRRRRPPVVAANAGATRSDRSAGAGALAGAQTQHAVRGQPVEQQHEQWVAGTRAFNAAHTHEGKVPHPACAHIPVEVMAADAHELTTTSDVFLVEDEDDAAGDGGGTTSRRRVQSVNVKTMTPSCHKDLIVSPAAKRNGEKGARAHGRHVCSCGFGNCALTDEGRASAAANTASSVCHRTVVTAMASCVCKSVCFTETVTPNQLLVGRHTIEITGADPHERACFEKGRESAAAHAGITSDVRVAVKDAVSDDTATPTTTSQRGRPPAQSTASAAEER